MKFWGDAQYKTESVHLSTKALRVYIHFEEIMQSETSYQNQNL